MVNSLAIVGVTQESRHFSDGMFKKEVISTCTLAMVIDAAGRNPEQISRKLYKELESYSKVRLPFYKKFDEKMKDFVFKMHPGAVRPSE